MSGRLIYDGDCGFCTACAHWIQARTVDGIEIVSWQRLGLAAVERLGLTHADVTEAAWWIDEDGQPHRGHHAIAQALRRARSGWPVVGRLLDAPGVSRLAGPAYSFIARHRHRLPGATPACRN